LFPVGTCEFAPPKSAQQWFDRAAANISEGSAMKDVLTAATEIQAFFQSRRWDFCIIGGIALGRWGQPRTTGDVDVTLLTGFADETVYIDELLAQFRARRDNAREFALEHRVLLLQASNGIGLDIALAGLPFEKRLVERATDYDFGDGISLRTASANDMVVLKAFAGRPQDWIDVEGIIIRQGDALDWNLILRELKPLCELKESPETVDQLLQLRDQLTRS
jgi:hypothetical protein